MEEIHQNSTLQDEILNFHLISIQGQAHHQHLMVLQASSYVSSLPPTLIKMRMLKDRYERCNFYVFESQKFE